MHANRYARIDKTVREHDWDALRAACSELLPRDIADAFAIIEPSRASEAFLELEEPFATEVFEKLSIPHRVALFEALPIERAKRLLAHLPPDDRTSLLESLDPEAARRTILLLDPKKRSQAKELLSYPEESAGRLMSPNFVSVHGHWTAAYALEHIRLVAHPSTRLEVVYVVDESGRLIDELELTTLVTAEPDALVSSLIDEKFYSLDAFDDRERAVQMMKRNRSLVLPVVDPDGSLLGIITADDVFHVAEAEATEDIHKSGSITPLDTGYRHASVFTLVRSRIGWLSALVLVSLLSSGVISFFEETLAEQIALVFFIPLLMATAGNTGAQSATLLVRAIATDDVHIFEWWKVFGKELLVGATLGAVLALVAYLLGSLQSEPMIGLVIALTMLSIVILANLLGAVLPFVLSKLKIDPAVASAPLITSIADAIGLVIYFSFATMLLGL